MRTHIVRRRLAQAAVAAASAALVAACGQHPATAPNPGNGTGPQAGTVGFKAGVALISDGTTVLRVGDQKVTFPTTVTDAAFSPDGSRIAFVDGDGNVATARPDGRSVKALTAKAGGVVRSHPSWQGNTIVFSEKSGNAEPVVKAAYANGSGTSYQDPGERDQHLGQWFEAADPSKELRTGSSVSAATTGNGVELAFQRAGAKGPEIWVSDFNQRTPFQAKKADGSEPALSPDGKRVAFVDPSGQIEVLDAIADKASPVKVSFGATSPTHLVWTPDGRIAYSTPTGVESIASTVAAGATSNPATTVSSAPGVSTFLPAARDRVTRVVGNDPVDLTLAASQAVFPTQDVALNLDNGAHLGAGHVLLTGPTNLSTILAGAQMIGDGPLLFTTGSTLDSRTATEIKRVLGRYDSKNPASYLPTVQILGGTDVVPAQAEAAVRALGYSTVRITAADPISMAATASGNPLNRYAVMVVDAADPVGYLAAVSDLGVYSNQVVLLTDGSTMPDRDKTYLNGVDKSLTKVYPIGSAAQAAMASSWSGKPSLPVIPLTVGQLLARFSAEVGGVVVVDRSNPTDVIAAIGLARAYGASVLAIDPKAGLDDATRAWLDGASASIDKAFIVDSKGTIGPDVEKVLSGLVAGPLGSIAATNPKYVAQA